MLAEELLKMTTKGLFNLGRLGASKAIKSNTAKRKLKCMTNKYLDQALDSVTSDLSKKLDPFHNGGGVYQRGEGIPLPFPFVDWNKAWNVVSDPGLFKGPSISEKEGKAMVAEYKRQYKAYKDAGGSRSYNSWVKWKGYGGALDIHKAILKVAPKKGFVMPGHRYTGPGNPLEQQLRYDPNTGQILEIYQQPTGRTDAVSMQHDVDYSVCGNKPKGDQVECKNDADRKMVKSLDAIPWKERQWGHTIARNAIAAKSKLGMGVKPKNGAVE